MNDNSIEESGSARFAHTPLERNPPLSATSMTIIQTFRKSNGKK
jgi:hypothetical protein